MTAKTRQQSGTQSIDSLMDFEDHELQQTLNEFLEDEQKENTNIWNFSTIAGIAMFLVIMVYMIQSIIGLNLGPDLSGIVEYLPLVGGILVTLVGFGFFVGDRRRERQAKKKKKSRQKSRYDFESMDDRQGDVNFENDLGRKRTGRRFSDEKYQFDRYAFRQRKKLYKSRSNKKLAGVCGGLAEYFGISTTVVRFLFVFAFFAGSGTSLLLYIALAIALDKEPQKPL
ncbi:phage shock protein C (PspC) family protein [Fodinibius roseus]|uniref:Phage shock protein C (PspC) family protein n=1 Tax=Fodinibius roseus TaxID=1194090 RepID=A0A1M4SWA0_9BACT|nr:PspC domain-containing protein [Fodinibius roseus]SHE36480.1 phage shock protein C (PspC) family protein [Fodinibius roseus]